MAGEVHDVVATRLRHAGQRYTTGRRRLVDLLVDAAGPVTITHLLDRDANLAQSSAYRNLAVLEQAGAVQRVITADEFARYELAEDLREHHHHLICSVCGDVADFHVPDALEDDLRSALDRAAGRRGFEIDHHRLDLVGTCASCR